MGENDDAALLTRVALPWATPPSGQGAQACSWCGRDIYRPAVPCSVRPVPGLLAMETRPGFGDRCKWELETRAGEETPAGAGWAA